MTTEIDKESTYEIEIKEFKDSMFSAAEEVFDRLLSERLPYLEHDNEMNVGYRTQEVVRKLLCGEYTFEDECLRVEQNGFLLYVEVTEHKWNSFRKEFIKLIPKCPKDLEIESLKEQLKMAQDIYDKFF